MFNIAPISELDWQDLQCQLRTQKYKKNSYYFRSGDTESQIGFVVSGGFRWYHIDEKGNLTNYHFFLEGDFVAEYYSFVAQKPSAMYIEALEDSEVILFPHREEILRLYSASHCWEKFGRIIAEKSYTETASRLHDFLFKNAEERYLDLIQRWPGIFQQVSLTNIASYLGVKVPSLSRIRRRVASRR